MKTKNIKKRSFYYTCFSYCRVAKPSHNETHLRSVKALVHTVRDAKEACPNTEPGE